MKFSHTLTYEATPTEVYEMLMDPEFRRRSGVAQHVVSAEVTITPSGDGHHVAIDQIQPTQGLPSFAKKFTGDTTHAIQVEEWSGPEGGTITVTTPGRPAEIHGTLSIVGVDGGTEERFEGVAKVKVPLIGGKLEGLVADLFRKGMDKEHDAGVAWLAGER